MDIESPTSTMKMPLPTGYPGGRAARSGAGLDRALRAVLGRPPPVSSETAVQKEQRLTKTNRREILIPQPREQVWRVLTDSIVLAEWMFPNDLEPRVGHQFRLQVPPYPK